MGLDTTFLGKENHHVLVETTAQNKFIDVVDVTSKSSLKTWAFNNERLIGVIS
jgi:hypothetical protein